MKLPPRSTTRRLLAALGCSALAVAVLASPASAAAPPAGSSRASANGVAPYLLGGNVLIPDATATNDGTIQPYAIAGAGAIASGLPSFIAAGVVGQRALAYPSNTTALSTQGAPLVSAACAGLVSSSSALSIGSTGACDTGGAQDGIRIELGVSSLASIGLRAGALYSSCTIDQDGQWTASAHGVNARIVSTLAGITTTLFPIDLSTPPNTGIGLGFVGQILSNNVIVVGGSQDGEWIGAGTPLPADADGIQTSAFVGTLLGTGFRIGQSTCYRSIAADDPNIPVVPAEGAPYAAATVVVMAAGAEIVRRRRPTGSVV
jgi:hypothetical protein